jgi:putative ABC transport system permease protein
MFKSYFKIAWRNLIKNKVYSLIHIAGLAIGMTVSMAIGLWIWDEISFNTYHENHRLIAQVGVTQIFNGPAQTEMTVAMPLGESLRTDYADDFRYVALASPNDEHTLSRGDKIISGSGMWVQADFPVMMTLKMEKGHRAALKDPSTLLLSASMAHTLFGD